MWPNAHNPGKKTGLKTFRSHSQQERMAYKRRLVLRRQGFVCVAFVTPTSCVSHMWITGIEVARRIFDFYPRAGHRPDNACQSWSVQIDSLRQKNIAGGARQVRGFGR
ncbi:hypothetical protein BQ8794_10043 [Mesorhizobium prunaredense]|uniref:Uncharacterized protein n=1 Tax=Mesorhizobium prunaredense TaxID=1631249 RepID=A0A1R3UYF8_9HYPH|nr:hypothetical protein BQ8794_10043 [Mesorhizobium prunaredense]